MTLESSRSEPPRANETLMTLEVVNALMQRFDVTAEEAMVDAAVWVRTHLLRTPNRRSAGTIVAQDLTDSYTTKGVPSKPTRPLRY